MKNWKETTLGEVAELQRGFDLPIQNRQEGIYPLMVSNGQDGTHNEYKVKGPGIVTGRSGTIGQVFFVKENFWPLNTTLWVKDFHGNDPKFIYYLLKTIPFDRFNTGSGVPTLNRNHIHPYPVFLPPLEEQKEIAGILGSLDDKIELLREENKTLEATAQTIFKEWFVNFNFPNAEGKPYKSAGGKMIDSELGLIPDGWRVGKLEELCERLASGGTPSTGSDEYWKGDINWFSTKELQDNYLFESEKKITNDGLSSSSAKMFPTGSVVMAIYAAPTVGRLGILGKESTFNQAACGFVANQNVACNEFLYLFLHYSRKDLNNLANGAAQQNISVGLLRKLKLVIPNSELMIVFNEIISPIFTRILNNSLQIQTLSTLRDTLLPKLMNGEVKTKPDFLE